jgi:hypothetical protein
VKIVVNSDTGDIEISKADGSVVAPQAPPAPPEPTVKPPKPPKPEKSGKAKKVGDVEVM